VADLADDFRVRKMTTIPCEYVIHSVPCSNSYVNGVRCAAAFWGINPFSRSFSASLIAGSSMASSSSPLSASSLAQHRQPIYIK
jgi:hypothetical protein